MRPELVIVGGARTAMAEYSGTPGYGLLKDITANRCDNSHAKELSVGRAGIQRGSGCV